MRYCVDKFTSIAFLPMKTQSDLIEIIKNHPGSKVVFDEHCWWLQDDRGRHIVHFRDVEGSQFEHCSDTIFSAIAAVAGISIERII